MTTKQINKLWNKAQNRNLKVSDVEKVDIKISEDEEREKGVLKWQTQNIVMEYLHKNKKN